MSEPEVLPQPSRPARLRAFLRLFNLRSDQADAEQIDADIREGTRRGGTNLWVLVLAIVIASVGLNVNSTAVIIGAMLISPLMGPIIAAGYGAAVHDSTLIRHALATLGIFVALSLLASTAYFLVSPLTQAHSELLARTSPNVWDVLIAFFGGAAGMIGLTRRERKTTLIPGVAIATALMPPLCTAGYGLASGQPAFFAGAFYLFVINGVFIALATLAVARVLRLPPRAQPTWAAQRHARAVITFVVLATLLPSAYLAWRLVNEEIYTATAERFVQRAVQSRDEVTLLSREIEPRRREITLTLIAPAGAPALQAVLERELAAAGLAETRLLVRGPTDARPDLGALRRDLQAEVLRGTLSAAEAHAARIAQLESRLDDLANRGRQPAPELAQIEREAAAQWPEAGRIVVTSDRPQAGAAGRPVVVLTIDARRPWPQRELTRLERWLQARLPDAETHVVKARLAP